MADTTKETPKKIVYILHYRQGQNPHPMNSAFEADSSIPLTKLIDRAKRFCTNMNWRFISIKPFIIDMDKMEKEAGVEELVNQ